MTLNIDKHKTELVEAWKEVMDIKNPINWALFGYCGQTFDLKLISKGDGGLAEMNEDFNSGKVMYGLCRVEVKERNVEKIALINWQGEGAPLSQKGTCANHLTTIKHFFPGIHVTINARTEEEVEPELIERHVAKTIAGDMIRASSTDMDSSDRVLSKVGSNYTRVNPLEEINSKAKSDFWKKEEEEEESRKRTERHGQRKYVENEVKLLRRESMEYFNNEEAKSCSPTPSGSTGSAASSPIPRNGTNSTSPTPTLPNTFCFQSEKEAVLRASAPRKSSTGNLVRDRIKSFDGSAGMIPGNVNGTSNRNGNSNGANSTSPDSISVIRRKEMFESGGTSTSPIPRRNPSEEIKMLQNAQKQVPEYRSPSPPKNTKSPSPLPANQTQGATKAPASFRIGGSVSVKLAEKVNQNSEISLTHSPLSGTGSTTDASSQETVIENNTAISSPTPPPPAQFRNEEPIPYDTSVRSGEIGVYSGTTGPTAIGAIVTKSPEIQPDMGLCAKALYDYQAADESEITFDPGDLITNIETIDEGWWEGRGPNGIVGLFPANYVELLN